jgi:hypothetical protein
MWALKRGDLNSRHQKSDFFISGWLDLEASPCFLSPDKWRAINHGLTAQQCPGKIILVKIISFKTK